MWTRCSLILSELVLILALFSLYKFGRLVGSGRIDIAFANAERVWEVERFLHLPNEARLQDLASRWPTFMEFTNYYYVYMHFPTTIAFLMWFYIKRPRAEYVWARTLMVIQTSLALTLTLAVPLAPPRMLPDKGFTDSMATIGPSAYDGSVGAAANQFAAMPSLHVGWAALIALVVWRTTSHKGRYLAVAHACMTLMVVTLTANHWLLDGLVAVALLAIALYFRPAPRHRARRPAHVDASAHDFEAGPAPVASLGGSSSTMQPTG